MTQIHDTTNSGNTAHISNSSVSPDYTTLSNLELISRITSLEAQLRRQTEEIAALTKSNHTLPVLEANPPSPLSQIQPSRTKKDKQTKSKAFDPSRYSTRFIALKFSYLGGRYNGFEHANGSAPPPKPTIEEVLWKALRKTRLISPLIEDGADNTFDVVWDPKERAETYGSGVTVHKLGKRDHDNLQHRGGAAKLRLDLNWDGCQYSKCGRTDRGVSAFGQVIGVRVRSKRPLEEVIDTNEPDAVPGSAGLSLDQHAGETVSAISQEDGTSKSISVTKDVPFDGIQDELPYVSMLNAILPPDIRVLAWCPQPPPDFDARFSCRERRYKYFFTNPAFCPTPGPLGMKFADGSHSHIREGWLDVEKMKEAAKKLEGLHDFRNLCKIDPSKQMPSCERRITYADIEEFGSVGSAVGQMPDMTTDGGDVIKFNVEHDTSTTPRTPKTYAFAVHGSAFLWHQVRCMVAILFLVGQGLEQPDVVDRLLDVQRNPRRPMYELAEDGPLVLWDCIFPSDTSLEYSSTPMSDSIDWVYAGDSRMIQGLVSRSDGKFGLGGVADELWTQWRSARMNEILAGSLLDMVLWQGDGSALQRGGIRDPTNVAPRSQRIFDGDDNAKIIGRYIPVMQKPTLDTLEAQNAKYLATKGIRRRVETTVSDAGGD